MSITMATSPITTQTSGIADGSDNIFRIKDISEADNRLDKDDGSYGKLLRLKGSDKVNQVRHYWIETNKFSPHLVCATDCAAAATTLVVSDAGAVIGRSKIFNNSTGEIMIVTSKSTNTLTVVRAKNGIDEAITAGDKLTLMAPGLAESMDALDPIAGVYSNLWNYISRTSRSIKGTHLQENSKMVGGLMQLTDQAVNLTLQLKEEMNQELWNGARLSYADQTAANGQIYSTGGFKQFVTTNYLDMADVTGALNWKLLNEKVRASFVPSASSDEKFLFCGEKAYASLMEITDGHSLPVEMSMGVDQNVISKLGLMIKSIMTDEGKVVHIVLDRNGFPAGAGEEKDGAIVDLANIGLLEFAAEPLAWRRNIQTAASHVIKHELWGSFGLKVVHESTHMRLKGLAPSS